MELTRHLQEMWARRRVILAVSVLAAGLVFAVSSRQPPSYTAKATIQVSVPGVNFASDLVGQNVTYLREVYLQRLAGPSLLASALERADLPPQNPVASPLGAQVGKGPGTIEVRATWPDRAGALRLAAEAVASLQASVATEAQSTNEAATRRLRDEIAVTSRELAAASRGTPLADSLINRYSALATQLAAKEGQVQPQLLVVAPAQAPEVPTSPLPRRNALLAFLIALIFTAEAAAFAAVVRRGRGRLPRDPSGEVARMTGLPVVDLDASEVSDKRHAQSMLAAMLIERNYRTRVLVLAGVDATVDTDTVADKLVSLGSLEGLRIGVIKLETDQADVSGRTLHERHALIRRPEGVLRTASLSRVPVASASLPVVREPDGWARVLDEVGEGILIVLVPDVLSHSAASEVVARTYGDLALVVAKRSRRRALQHALSTLAVARVQPLSLLLNGPQRQDSGKSLNHKEDVASPSTDVDDRSAGPAGLVDANRGRE